MSKYADYGQSDYVQKTRSKQATPTQTTPAQTTSNQTKPRSRSSHQSWIMLVLPSRQQRHIALGGKSSRPITRPITIDESYAKSGNAEPGKILIHPNRDTDS